MQDLDCQFCRRTFYKLEHLKRHERSHTGSRPFVCSICDRAFNRQDSLFRHKRLHSRRDNRSYASPESSNNEVPLSGAEDNLDIDTESLHSGPTPTTLRSQPTSIPLSPEQSIDPNQLDTALIWPDSEDLFRTIVSFGSGDPWQSSLASEPFSSSLPSHFGVARFGDQAPSIDSIPAGGNNQVVSCVSNMIHQQSSSVTAAVNISGINSVFLDECLHMFFVRFSPTFLILHRPTFVFRDCIQPLLLNCMAIGSLYLGHSNSIARGEVLWRLAHTALATMWQHMISHRGPYDERPGVQLLVTSLLGQVYGILSKNPTIRMTSQAFYVLAFVWAKQCGISTYDFSASELSPPWEGTDFEKDRFWRRWVARNIQQRTSLAYYALDGLIARMTGTTTSEGPISNHFSLMCDENAFAAQTIEEFFMALQANQMSAPGSHQTFKSTFRQLLSPTQYGHLTGINASPFTLMILQEGLQSVMTRQRDEFHDARTNEDLNHALLGIHELISENIHMSNADKLEATLRWHAICLESIINTSKLCQRICRSHNIEQNLWMTSYDDHSGSDIDLLQWAQTSNGRRALLHAVAIQTIVEDLPRGRAHAVHMPSALFAAATICAVFCLGGITTVNLPSTVDWQEAVSTGISSIASIDGSSRSNNHQQQQQQQLSGVLQTTSTATISFQNCTRRFIRGEFDSSTAAFGVYRNLIYEFNSMQKLFGCLATQWGVAGQMSSIVREWAIMFH